MSNQHWLGTTHNSAKAELGESSEGEKVVALSIRHVLNENQSSGSILLLNLETAHSLFVQLAALLERTRLGGRP